MSLSCEEFLNKLQNIVEDTCNFTDNFVLNIEKWRSCTKQSISERTEQKNDFNIFYETVLININNGDKVMAYNKQKYKEVDKKISDSFAKLTTLKQERALLEKKLASVEESLSKTKQRSNPNVNKLIKQQILEDEVRACKLLSSTNFNYSGSGILGYVLRKDTKTYKTFSFDPNEDSQVTEKLWKILEKVSKERQK